MQLFNWNPTKVEALNYNVGTSGNTDYRGLGPRTGQQAIYDSEGNLVSTPENMGTYDYESPGIFTLDEHHYLDIIPWLIWGSSPLDSTTYEARVKAFTGKEENLKYFEFFVGEPD